MIFAKMSPSDWIALAALIVTILTAILGLAMYLGRVLGALPGQIAEAVRTHERSCTSFSLREETNPRLEAPRQRTITGPPRMAAP